MTDFEKIKAYYLAFNEQHRLDKADGRLEYEISLGLLSKYIKMDDKILDLGGGAGKYSIELASRGYKVTLADLSEKLLKQAEDEIINKGIPKLQSIDLVNAIDLSCYKDRSFDAIILFGPLYHLLESDERQKCVSEVFRVLKPGGLVFASFIPYLSGLAGIVSRALYFSDQVDINNLNIVLKEGKFINNASCGFQEGYFPTSEEIEKLFEKNYFKKIMIRSIRGIGYNREEKLYELYEKNKALYEKIIELINYTASDKSLIETCGHAIYIGYKNK